MTEGKHLDNGGMEQVMPSRRKFLAGSAALLAGGALMAVPGVAKAHETNEGVSDVDILNYALTLEHLEYAFYRDGLRKFGRKDLNWTVIVNRGGKAIRRPVYDEFVRIRDREDQHVDTLTSVIGSLGGTPVLEATYNFETTAFTSVEQFVNVAQLLENTGVMAYDGAIAHIEDAELLTAGATIATVEARHASYLNLLNGETGFPDAFDDAMTPREICRTVDEAFITGDQTPYPPYPSLAAFCEMLPNTTS